jgi:hypothetical protein
VVPTHVPAKSPVAVKLACESKTVFGPALRMFVTVLVAVKLPVPVEEFEAFATETSEKTTITITAIFNNLIFLIHLLRFWVFLSQRPSSALCQK